MSGADNIDLNQALSFANEFADRSRKLLIERAGKFTVERKLDASEVTDLDREIEQSFRAEVARVFPGFGVIGEEFGSGVIERDFIWVIDPIDGTQNFVRNIPTFGIILGLHFRGEQIVGLIDHPQLDLRYTAAKGHGTRCNGSPLSLPQTESSTPPYARNHGDALIAVSSPANLSRFHFSSLWSKLLEQHPNVRIYGDCFAQTAVLSGQVDAALHVNFKLWDAAALEILTREAGGTVILLGTESSRSDTYYTYITGHRAAAEYLERLVKSP